LVAKNIEEFQFFKKLSYKLVCSQIWQNQLMDDHHFSYITKLEKKKNPAQHYGQSAPDTTAH